MGGLDMLGALPVDENEVGFLDFVNGIDDEVDIGVFDFVNGIVDDGLGADDTTTTSSDSPTRTSTEVRSPTRTSTEVRSPTRTATEVRSPTRTATSTEAETAGNFTATVTGGAGAGATSVTINATAPTGGMKWRGGPAVVGALAILAGVFLLLKLVPGIGTAITAWRLR